MSFKNMKESVDKYLIKELEEKVLKKDLLIIDLLWMLIDRGVNLTKAGYQDLLEEYEIDYDDKNNIHKRRREGYELVMAEDYPDFDAPVIDEGKNAGVIGTGGLLLARVPEEIVEQRKKYFEDKTQTQMDAVDRDWMRENNPVMPKLKPQRNSNVSFGNNRNLNDD